MISVEVRALFARLKDEPRRIVFPFTLPGRNELDAAARRGPFEYSKFKKKHQNDVVAWAARYARRFEPIEGKSLVGTVWREEDRRRDPSNIVDGGRKILLDGLARGRRGPCGWSGAGVIHCDGWHCLTGFVDLVVLAEDGYSPGVEVVIAPLQLELPLTHRARRALVDLRT